jgi:hypothetical protein
MVMRASSPERWCLSSARKSAVARLVAGVRAADGVRGAVGEHNCVVDGSGAPPGWFACHPPRGVVLIDVMMS